MDVAPLSKSPKVKPLRSSAAGVSSVALSAVMPLRNGLSLAAATVSERLTEERAFSLWPSWAVTVRLRVVVSGSSLVLVKVTARSAV